jgi:hypothetical protein
VSTTSQLCSSRRRHRICDQTGRTASIAETRDFMRERIPTSGSSIAIVESPRVAASCFAR